MVFDFEETYTGQVAAAHDKYMITDPAHEVKADHDARVAAAAAAYDTITNAELGDLPSGVSYDGTKEITVAANRAGVDALPEDTQGVEDLEHEVLVNDAAAADELHETGGQIPPDSYTGVASLSPYVDMLWLAERSKQTGVKHF